MASERVTPAELRFKAAVTLLIRRGQYPSPNRLNALLHKRRGQQDNLNSRECQWRREACKVMKFRLKGKNL